MLFDEFEYLKTCKSLFLISRLGFLNFDVLFWAQIARNDASLYFFIY